MEEDIQEEESEDELMEEEEEDPHLNALEEEEMYGDEDMEEATHEEEINDEELLQSEEEKEELSNTELLEILKQKKLQETKFEQARAEQQQVHSFLCPEILTRDEKKRQKSSVFVSWIWRKLKKKCLIFFLFLKSIVQNVLW